MGTSIQLGKKIRQLRKDKGISQEILARHLHLSYQTVSKWENGVTMPDVALLPAIAAFFGVSTDELLDYNLYAMEEKVRHLSEECWKLRDAQPPNLTKAEQLIRDGLKTFPGNDILLNNLAEILFEAQRYEETVEQCRALAEISKADDIRYDAIRLMAESYSRMGDYISAKAAVERLPELYFTKLQIAAQILDGENRYRPAIIQKSLSLEHLLSMLQILADIYTRRGEPGKAKIQLQIACEILNAFQNDFPTEYTHSAWDTFKTLREKIEEDLRLLS